MVVCDGCGKEMERVGEIHEIFYNYIDRFPELCGYGKRVNRRDWERWQKEKKDLAFSERPPS